MPDMAEATIQDDNRPDPDHAEIARNILNGPELDVVARSMELWMRAFLKDFATLDSDELKLATITEAFLNNPEGIVLFALQEVINVESEYAAKLAAEARKIA